MDIEIFKEISSILNEIKDLHGRICTLEERTRFIIIRINELEDKIINKKEEK